MFSLRASKLETETRNYILRFCNREEVHLTDFFGNFGGNLPESSKCLSSVSRDGSEAISFLLLRSHRSCHHVVVDCKFAKRKNLPEKHSNMNAQIYDHTAGILSKCCVI